MARTPGLDVPAMGGRTFTPMVLKKFQFCPGIIVQRRDLVMVRDDNFEEVIDDGGERKADEYIHGGVTSLS